MSWRPREIKDRLMHSGGDRLIRKVRNAGRRVGGAAAGSRGGRRAAKPGVDLHFRGLQEPAGELEAVLDDLDATSDPIFSGTAVDKNEQARFSSSAQQHHQGPTDKRDGGTRAREHPHVSTKCDEDDPLFPSDGEDVSADVDGERRLPRQATGPTDSEESEDLDLDEAVAAEVLESLHLLAGNMGPDELFDSQSPPSSTVVVESGEREGGGGGEGTKRRQGIQAGNNESANNNTHTQEAGETLAPSASETLSSGGPLTHGTSVSVDYRLQKNYEPSLEELLEHGSAALPSRPYSSSPRRPHGSPRALDTESSPSPLTSSNESYPSDPLFTSTNQTLRPTTREANGTRLPAVKHVGFDSKPPGSAEQKGLAQEQAVNGNDNIVPKPPAHSPTSGSPVKDCSSGVRNVSLTSSGTQGMETDVEGRESGKKYSRNDSDELFPDDSKLVVDSGVTERSQAATIGDDLFPDDAKLLKHSETSRKSSNKRNSDENTLEIREDHFSPSPEERRKNQPPPPSQPSPPSPPSSASTHSSSPGKKTGPPRPPRSPQLNSRLKLRQSQQSQSVLATTSTPPPSRRVLPSKVSPEVARVKTTSWPLSSSPPGPSRTIINETDTSEPSLKESPQIKATTSERRGSLQSSSVAPHPPQSSPEDLQPPTARTESVSDENEIDSVELPFLSLSVHLSLTLFLYFYYTLNPFAYLAGLVAGFLLFYLCLGAVFVAYVQREGEETAEGSRTGGSVTRELSVEFMKSTNIQLEDYKTRFTAPSRKHNFEFTATLQYDVATHHRRDRLRCRLKLINDFELSIHIFDSEGDSVMKRSFNLRNEGAKITIVPEDVFQNRKRRWSKKYPIRMEVGGCVFFLFSNVSRFKQEWFFRLREAANGTTTEELVQKKHVFFGYMLRYLSNKRSSQRNSASVTDPPTSSTAMKSSFSSMGSHSTTTGQMSSRHHAQHRRPRGEEGMVQFSSTTAMSDREEDVTEGSVSISTSHFSGQPPHASITSTISSSSSVADYSLRPSSARSLSNASSVGPASPLPSAAAGSPSSLESYWINAVSARIFWDVWHEERWKKWIVSRIERKLVRIKTPRFLDPLQLTDVAIGESMPVINRLSEGPYLKVDGVWLFFDVEYEGEFVMTIKTRLKLGHWRKGKEEKGTELRSMKHQSRVGHSQAAVILQESSGIYPDEDDSETGSEEEEEEEEERHALSNPLEEEEEEEEGEDKLMKPTAGASHSSPEPQQPSSPVQRKKKRGARLRKVVSNITKRVANNRLVRRATERAVEKASNIPLELTVEVRKLKGVVAVNIPPPPSDTIWYGFKSTPKLELVARPKLGKRAVTFSQITHWIERKLCSLVDEKLTLPNMEDLVVPVLNSGLPEDTQKSLS